MGKISDKPQYFAFVSETFPRKTTLEVKADEERHGKITVQSANGVQVVHSITPGKTQTIIVEAEASCNILNLTVYKPKS